MTAILCENACDSIDPQTCFNFLHLLRAPHNGVKTNEQVWNLLRVMRSAQTTTSRGNRRPQGALVPLCCGEKVGSS